MKLFKKDELVSEVLAFAATVGLTEITPVVLSDGGNLILHLAPHPIVARISTVLSEQDSNLAHATLNRELQVASHLKASGVPVLLPADHLGLRPYSVRETWMTFWNYESPAERPNLALGEGVRLVNQLSDAMRQFSGELPLLGVWERTCESATRLRSQSDVRIRSLLAVFQKADEQMRSKGMVLVPCHGDAHRGNLLSSPRGWLWQDFEDVSWMPIYWDMASFVGNLVLFHGLQEPTYQFMLEQLGSAADRKSLTFNVSARILMSTLGNMDYALAGHGNMQFATRQLELAEGILDQLKIN